MVIQFTLQELMLFLMFAIAIAAGVLLLPILWNIKRVVSIVRTLLVTHQEAINDNIRLLPEICENARHISSNVRETTDNLRISVPGILQDVENVSSAARGSIELASVVMEKIEVGVNDTIAIYTKDSPSVIEYIHLFEEVLQMVYRTFSASK